MALAGFEGFGRIPQFFEKDSRIPQYLRLFRYMEYVGLSKVSRLNNLVFMNVHKEKTKRLSLAGVANEFAAVNDRRRAHFGNKKFM